MKRADPSKYTPEVQAALRQLQPEPEPVPPPDGQVRYHLAVGSSVQTGTASPSIVAALLRSMADQLTKETQHG